MLRSYPSSKALPGSVIAAELIIPRLFFHKYLTSTNNARREAPWYFCGSKLPLNVVVTTHPAPTGGPLLLPGHKGGVNGAQHPDPPHPCIKSNPKQQGQQTVPTGKDRSWVGRGCPVGAPGKVLGNGLGAGG